MNAQDIPERVKNDEESALIGVLPAQLEERDDLQCDESCKGKTYHAAALVGLFNRKFLSTIATGIQNVYTQLSVTYKITNIKPCQDSSDSCSLCDFVVEAGLDYATD